MDVSDIHQVRSLVTMHYLSYLLGVLLTIISFSAVSCNCGYSLAHYFGESKSVHLIEVTSLLLQENKGDQEIKIGFKKIETLTKNNFLPENLFLTTGGCTPSMMPGSMYVVFIPDEGKNESTSGSENGHTRINMCTGIIGTGYMRYPKENERYQK